MSACSKKCSVIVIVALLAAALLPQINARPSSSRQKRVSDQRLAELETLLALAKMKGKLVTVPIGFGRIDFEKIGRRRRRSSSFILNNKRNSAAAEQEVEQILAERERLLSEQDEPGEERSGSSPQYEDLLRQYLLAWAKEDHIILA